MAASHVPAAGGCPDCGVGRTVPLREHKVEKITEGEQDMPIDEVILGAILGPESRTVAAKRLGISKLTLYVWGKRHWPTQITISITDTKSDH